MQSKTNTIFFSRIWSTWLFFGCCPSFAFFFFNQRGPRDEDTIWIWVTNATWNLVLDYNDIHFDYICTKYKILHYLTIKYKILFSIFYGKDSNCLSYLRVTVRCQINIIRPQLSATFLIRNVLLKKYF